MKKTLVAISVLAGITGAYGQGQLVWNDAQTSYAIAIMSPNPTSPQLEQSGQSFWDSPSGGNTYGGGWIGNTGAAPGHGIAATPSSFGTPAINFQTSGNFEVGLYLDTSLIALSADIASGTPIATTIMDTAVANAGLYQSTTTLLATDNTYGGGTAVFVGIAAWYSGGGATSYAQAYATVPSGYVESSSEVTLQVAPATINGLKNLGLTSFSLAEAVPEPSTIALGVIGASAFIMRLRRK